MKKIVIAVIAASSAFTITSLVPLHAETVVQHSITTREAVSLNEPSPASPIATVVVPEAPNKIDSQAGIVPIAQEPLSFASLSELNKNIDENQNAFQPYYIQSFILPGTGTYFTATNISADALTSGNATIGSLAIEDGAEISGTLNTERIITERITSTRGMTLYDRTTNQPYCLHIDGGVTQLEPNECMAD